MENTTVYLIITALTGIAGTIVGSVAPWLLRKIDTRAEKQETRRKMIVDFINVHLEDFRRYRRAYRSTHITRGRSRGNDQMAKEDFAKNHQSAIEASNNLYSVFSQKDVVAKKWINELCNKAYYARPCDDEEYQNLDNFFVTGLQLLLSWHCGEVTADKLRPFRLDSKNEVIWLDKWPEDIL